MKFRIWNKQLKKFVPSDEWFVNGDGEVFFHDIMDHELVNADSTSVVVQRFTGMVDKNGKEIYEGDIVKFTIDKGLGVIDYDVLEVKWWKHSWIIFDGFGHYPYEIIGNIFEK